jgi:hypothetical protein
VRESRYVRPSYFGEVLNANAYPLDYSGGIRLLVLLVGSGLMIRTFQALRAVEPGFTNPHQLQIMRIVRSARSTR